MTEADLLEALQKASEKPLGGEGLRVEEIRQATGMSEERIRTMLRTAIQSGTVKRGERYIERLDGRRCPVPSYVLVKR